jgi:hypothetical protein
MALPSAASASSWGVVGSTHLFTSSSLIFIAHLDTDVEIDCSHYQFHIDVNSSAAWLVTAPSSTAKVAAETSPGARPL